MAGEAYKVIIEGIASGRDPEVVRKKMAGFFKSNPAHLDTVLSGKPVVVKNTGDKDAAIKCHQLFHQVGVNCKVVRCVPAGKAAAGKKTAGAATPTRRAGAGSANTASPGAAVTGAGQARPAKGKAGHKATIPGQARTSQGAASKKVDGPEFINPMTCPACGVRQEKSDECRHCGTIIQKYIKMTGKVPPEFLQEMEKEEPEEMDALGGVHRVIGDHYGDEIGESYNFWSEAPLAFIYPFKGNGLFILIAGAIFFGILKVIPLLGIYRFAVMAFIGGYLAAYMFKVVNRSADKVDRPPNWPSLVNMGEDLALPFIRMLIPGIFCYIPAILAAVLFLVAPGKVYDYTGEFPQWRQDEIEEAAENDDTPSPYGYNQDRPPQNMPPFVMPDGQFNPYGYQAEEEYEEIDEDAIGYRFWTFIGGINPVHQLIVIAVLVMLGSMYYPMSILTVAMSGSLLALSPHLVIPGIFKTFIPYLFTCFLYLFALVLKWLADRFIVIPIPLTGPILEMFVTIYFLMVEARLLGVLYNANAEKLGWYED